VQKAFYRKGDFALNAISTGEKNTKRRVPEEKREIYS